MDTSAIKGLLNSLNEHQLAVANIGAGTAIVSGVPGSGKTWCIIGRIARLVMDGLDPRFIMAMTFTKAAAKEMEERLNRFGVQGCHVSTIHSLAYEILTTEKRMVEGLAVDEGFTGKMELRKVLENLRKRKVIDSGWNFEGIERYMQFCKAMGACYISGNVFGLNAAAVETHKVVYELVGRDSMLSPEQLYQIYTEMENRRAALAFMDYDDMLLWAYCLLLTDDNVRIRWSSRWSVIVVDEGQDTNTIQWEIIRLLCRRQDGNSVPLMVAGDPSQSLYGWRAAVPEEIVELSTKPGVGLYQLPLNYRSARGICHVATELVYDKSWHLSGKIIPTREMDLEGPPENCFTLKKFKQQMDEARWTIADILMRYRLGKPLRQMVVMARLSQYLNFVEVECIRQKIPYEKWASGSFLDSKEVQDLLAYLRVAGGLDPVGEFARKCVLSPFKYISKQQLEDAGKYCRERGVPYIQALLGDTSLGRRQRYAIVRLQDILSDLSVAIEDGSGPSKLLEMVISKTDYIAYIRERDGLSTVDSSKVAVIEELKFTATLFENVATFITFIDTVAASIKMGRKALSTANENQDRLLLSTIHRMKGLEVDIVYIGDVAQGRFPWNRAWSLDEELRLAYVAVTRAREHVTLTCSERPDAVESTIFSRVRSAILKTSGY